MKIPPSENSLAEASLPGPSACRHVSDGVISPPVLQAYWPGILVTVVLVIGAIIIVPLIASKFLGTSSSSFLNLGGYGRSEDGTCLGGGIGAGREETGWDGTGLDEAGWDRTGWDGTGTYGTGRDWMTGDESGRDGVGLDEAGWDRAGRDEAGRDGKERTGRDGKG